MASANDAQRRQIRPFVVLEVSAAIHTVEEHVILSAQLMLKVVALGDDDADVIDLGEPADVPGWIVPV